MSEKGAGHQGMTSLGVQQPCSNQVGFAVAQHKGETAEMLLEAFRALKLKCSGHFVLRMF